VKWLKTALNLINDGVRRNKAESKLAMKKITTEDTKPKRLITVSATQSY